MANVRLKKAIREFADAFDEWVDEFKEEEEETEEEVEEEEESDEEESDDDEEESDDDDDDDEEEKEESGDDELIAGLPYKEAKLKTFDSDQLDVLVTSLGGKPGKFPNAYKKRQFVLKKQK